MGTCQSSASSVERATEIMELSEKMPEQTGRRPSHKANVSVKKTRSNKRGEGQALSSSLNNSSISSLDQSLGHILDIFSELL